MQNSLLRILYYIDNYIIYNSMWIKTEIDLWAYYSRIGTNIYYCFVEINVIEFMHIINVWIYIIMLCSIILLLIKGL